MVLMYVFCDVFLFVITLPDCFFYMYCLDRSIYVFEKDIVLPTVVCHAHGRVKSLEYIPKRHCNRCVAGIYSTYSTAENIFVFRFL